MRQVILSLVFLVGLVSLIQAGPNDPVASSGQPGSAIGLPNTPSNPPGNAQPGHVFGKNGFHPLRRKNSATPPGHVFGNGNRPWLKKILGK